MAGKAATVKQLVQSLKARCMVLAAQTSMARSALSPRPAQRAYRSSAPCQSAGHSAHPMPLRPQSGKPRCTGAKQETPRESSCLAHQPLVWGSLGKACLSLLHQSPDQNRDLDGLGRLHPRHILWFGAMEAPHQQTPMRALSQPGR